MFKHVMLGFLLMGSGLVAADVVALDREIQECKESWDILRTDRIKSGLFNFGSPLLLQFGYDFDDAHNKFVMSSGCFFETIEEGLASIDSFQKKYASFYAAAFSERFLTSQQKNSDEAEAFTVLFSRIFGLSKKIQEVLGQLKTRWEPIAEEKK